MQSAKPKLCFGDLTELDHVIYLLDELADIADSKEAVELAKTGPIPVIIDSINRQIEWQRSCSEIDHPGAFDRSYLAEEYAKTLNLLTEIQYYPDGLPARRGEMVLSLHRVMILGNLTEEQLLETIKSRDEATSEAQRLRPFADIGMKSKAGSEKGNARRKNQERDKRIFTALQDLRKAKPKLPQKTLRCEVGKQFGVGGEAVKKACERHLRPKITND